MNAYDVFAAATETNALKVVLEGSAYRQLIAAGDSSAIAAQATRRRSR